MHQSVVMRSYSFDHYWKILVRVRGRTVGFRQL